MEGNGPAVGGGGGGRAELGLLGYARAGLIDAVRLPRWLRMVVLMLALPAAASGWLPFAEGVSPWMVVTEVWQHGLGKPGFVDMTMLLQMAVPFFVGVVLVGWSGRLAIRAPATVWERAGLWVVGWGSLAVTAVMISRILWQEGAGPDAWQAMLGGVAAVFGLGVMGLLWWRLHHLDAPTSVLLGTAYLANACVCLLGFRERAEIGWWVTVVAVGGIVGEMVIHILWAWGRVLRRGGR
jgi:hypothetical protein